MTTSAPASSSTCSAMSPKAFSTGRVSSRRVISVEASSQSCRRWLSRNRRAFSIAMAAVPASETTNSVSSAVNSPDRLSVR